jgi:hypothetical protein
LATDLVGQRSNDCRLRSKPPCRRSIVVAGQGVLSSTAQQVSIQPKEKRVRASSWKAEVKG